MISIYIYSKGSLKIKKKDFQFDICFEKYMHIIMRKLFPVFQVSHNTKRDNLLVYFQIQNVI